MNTIYRIEYFIRDFSLYLILLIASFFTLISVVKKIYKSQNSEKKKRLLLSLVFGIFSLILIYSTFEAYFRYRFDESDSLGFLRVTGRWFKRHTAFNSYFVRDREFQLSKKEGITRIGVIGDSITMGYGIKDVNNRFSDLLEKKLKNAGYNVEVYNLGKSGYDTDAELTEYKQTFKKLNFDIIIWEYFLNDAQPDTDKNTGAKIISKEKRQNDVAKIISHFSFFFDYVYWRLSARYDKTFKELRLVDMASYKDKANFQRHLKDVNAMIDEFKSNNKKVVVIVFPFLYPLPNYPAEDIHKTMDTIFRNANLDLIDMLDYFKNKKSKDLVVSRFDYHPNEYVQRLVADKLYDKIVPLLNK